MLRPDISKAIDATPANIRAEITGPAAASLELLNAYLSPDETVETMASASIEKGEEITSLLVVTDRRLIFIAPAPQAVGWRLSKLTKSQAYSGYFFVEGDAGEYSCGLVDDEWSTTFEGKVKQAASQAVLAGT